MKAEKQEITHPCRIHLGYEVYCLDFFIYTRKGADTVFLCYARADIAERLLLKRVRYAFLVLINHEPPFWDLLSGKWCPFHEIRAYIVVVDVVIKKEPILSTSEKAIFFG